MFLGAAIGYCIKWKIDLFGIDNLEKLQRSNCSTQIIVSLTSYGRRVSKVVYYTLISLLNQNLKPYRIILWLDKNQWNDDNLPKKIAKLKKYGVEIRYCEDIRSYTKLIPCLQEYPDDIIVTVDDDVYYSPKLLNKLYSGYLFYPNRIQCAFYSYPSFDKKGLICSYNSWSSKKDNESNLVFPMGVGGILYPPHSLYSDVSKQDLFMKLCPMADDIWFWFMALKQGTSYHIISMKGIRHYAFDNLYQYFHKGSALTHTNSKQNQNDYQVANLFKYYGIKNKKDILDMYKK